MPTRKLWGNVLILLGLLFLLLAAVSFVIQGSATRPLALPTLPPEPESPTPAWVAIALSRTLTPPPTATATEPPSATPEGTPSATLLPAFGVSPAILPATFTPPLATATLMPSATHTATGTPTPSATHTATLSLAATPTPLQATPAPSQAMPPPRIVIPKLGLAAGIVSVTWRAVETSEGILALWETAPAHLVGWHRDSVRAGERGNMVLSGHSGGNGVFARLEELEPGDEVLIYESEGVFYRYVVMGSALVPEMGASLAERLESARYLGPGDEARLTLITCWPSWAYTHRLIIIAKLAGF